MTKTSRLMLPVIVVTSVAWLGAACGPPSEPEPEATAAAAAQTAPDPEDRPTWKQCMADPNCIAGARVQVLQDEDGVCTVSPQAWFATEPRVINVDAKGRVFFLVQWQEECQDKEVFYSAPPPGDYPWENGCHEQAWKRTGQQSFRFFRCEVVDLEDDRDYDFCLEIDPDVECTDDRTGGTVRVRGSGRPPADDAPAR